MQFTAEHEQFRKSVRAFVESEINPNVDKWEEERIFPAHELFPKLADIGGFGLEYDEKYGGQGADHSFTVVLMEELGYSCDCAGVPMAIAVQSSMATPSLHNFGSPELKEKYLKPAMLGQQVCSVAVSEPDAGSDVSGIRTKAVQQGDEWVINGRKMWITNGSQADWICLLARTSDEPGFAGMSQIIVPTDSPGFSVGRTIEKMGNHSSDTAELVFEDLRVPGARRALERTIEYLQVREAFGKPLLANQYLQYNLAELIAEVDMMITYNREAARRFTEGENVTREATIAKFKVGKLARQVADIVVQYHGGMGYAEENWPARYMRDARLISIGGGADEVMLRIISMLEGMGKR